MIRPPAKPWTQHQALHAAIEAELAAPLYSGLQVTCSRVYAQLPTGFCTAVINSSILSAVECSATALAARAREGRGKGKERGGGTRPSGFASGVNFNICWKFRRIYTHISIGVYKIKLQNDFWEISCLIKCYNHQLIWKLPQMFPADLQSCNYRCGLK